MDTHTSSNLTWAQIKHQRSSNHQFSDEECFSVMRTRDIMSLDASKFFHTPLDFERESSLHNLCSADNSLEVAALKARNQHIDRLLTADFNDLEQSQSHIHRKHTIKHYSLERCSFPEIINHRILDSTIKKIRKTVIISICYINPFVTYISALV